MMIESSPSAVNRASPDVDEMSKPTLKPANGDVPLRKAFCRYGHGCTHMMDQAHREKFYHPPPVKLNDEKLQSHHICDECGFATSSLPDLMIHLKRKTAWSNTSLVGCRISCLVDMKEWHEGYVSQFHKSGKHYVEFRQANIRRWLTMKKVAFYIIERPPSQSGDGNEYKDSGDGMENLAPLEEKWVYSEEVSVEYAYAQSVLFKVFGNTIQETGHLTRGHVCLTESDKHAAQQMKSSLLYGELLPRGANKAFGAKRLEAYRATSLFDLGMGTGKIVVQAFLQFRNLMQVVGVELSQGRYKLAEEAALRMVNLLGKENFNVQINPGVSITITEPIHDPYNQYCERMLHMQCGNMFDMASLASVDVVMMETDIPAELHGNLQHLLSSMKEGARILTYLDLRKTWDHQPIPFKQMEANRHSSDRYPTSWSVQRGHHFFLWTKISHESSWGSLSLGFSPAAAVAAAAAAAAGASTSAAAAADPPESRSSLVPMSSSSLKQVSQKGSCPSHEQNEQTSPRSNRCLPLRLFGWGGDRRKSTRKLPLESTESSLVNGDRVIIPINADGSRADQGSSSSGSPASASSPSRQSPNPLPAPSQTSSASRPSPTRDAPSASPRSQSPRKSRSESLSSAQDVHGSSTIVIPADPQAGLFAPIADGERLFAEGGGRLAGRSTGTSPTYPSSNRKARGDSPAAASSSPSVDASGLLDFPTDIRSRLRASPSPLAESPRLSASGTQSLDEDGAMRAAVYAAAAGMSDATGESSPRGSGGRKKDKSKSRSTSPRSARKGASRSSGSPPPFCAMADDLVVESSPSVSAADLSRAAGRGMSSAALREAAATQPAPSPAMLATTLSVGSTARDANKKLRDGSDAPQRRKDVDCPSAPPATGMSTALAVTATTEGTVEAMASRDMSRPAASQAPAESACVLC